MKKKLSITTATVEIKMVSVEGKKMTKATYDQIREENPLFNGGIDFEKQVLGYVFDIKRDQEIVLYINKSGELRKTDLYPSKEFATNKAGRAEWNRMGWNFDNMSKEEIKELEEKDFFKEWISELKKFWELVLKNQVFIAT